jgi:phosphatidate cytidylyltransferase
MAREDEHDELEHTGYRSGQVRIVGAEPAGRQAASVPREPVDWAEESEDRDGSRESFVPPLPHWTEPATGEVPAVLSRDSEREEDPFASLGAPIWREEGSDWEAQDEEYEPSMLAGDQGQGALDTTSSDRQPWVFDLPGSSAKSELLDEDGSWDEESGEDGWEDVELGSAPSWSADADDAITAVLPAVPREDQPPHPVVEEPPQEVVGTANGAVIDEFDIDRREPEEEEEPRSRFRAFRPTERRAPPAARAPRPAGPPRRPAAGRLRPPTGPRVDEPPPRNVAAAIVSGVVLGGLALITFKAGPAAAVGLVTLIVTMAAAEAFAAFRKGGYHPVTLLGLVATVSLMIATYNKGQAALPLVFVLLVAACFVWHLAGVEQTDAVRSTGTTLFVFAWVAVFGSFGALLLSPSLFPNRHGIAFLLGGAIAAVAYDVGALTFGAWLGRHPMAKVSPNKTWEGFVGGLVTSLILSVVIVHLIHPWTVGKAAALGLLISVVATLGDLFESTVKRHLGLKDMGRLLPGHGGMLDRVDGLLFALPATYYLVIAFHLG